MTILETAVEYHKAGFQPMPLYPKSKVPIHKNWQQWSLKRIQRPDVVKMFKDNPEFGIGIVTGYASGTLVVDLDVKHAVDDPDEYLKALTGAKEWMDEHPSPLIAQTGTDGYHCFFRYVQGTHNRTDIFREQPRAYKVDIRSERGFVVAAPSIHDKTGKAYRWIKGGEDLFESSRKLTRPPKDIVQASYEAVGSAKPAKSWEKSFTMIGEGSRNNTFTEIVGSMLARYEPSFWSTFCWPLAWAWNKEYATPSLTEIECRKSFDSIAKSEMNKRERYAKRPQR